MISITIYDSDGGEIKAHWSREGFTNLEFVSEDPAGHVSAQFVVPGKYRMPYGWLDHYHQIEIRNGPTAVWHGFVWAVERFWDSNSSGIRVQCLGDAGRLVGWTLDENLADEKASAYITDHIITHSQFPRFLTVGAIDTDDYTIPGVREYKPMRTIREILDDLISFNLNTHTWQIWNREFSWLKLPDSVDYVTSTDWCTGSVRQDLADYANRIVYSYRDAAGVIRTGSVAAGSRYPEHAAIENYAENMTSVQASQLANASLSQRSLMGASSEISVWRVTDQHGRQIHPSELRPGKLIRIDGLIPARATPTEAFVENDYDVFRIRSVSYDHDRQVARVGPGRLPYTLPRVMAR